MKNIYNILFVLISTLTFSQVGINTEQPTRTLDVNGNERLQNTEYKINDPNYNKVLVINDNGNVDAWDKVDIIAKVSDLIVETKKFYSSVSPDPNIQVPCGKFILRFSDDSLNTIPQIKLKAQSSTNTTIYYNIITKQNNSGNGFNASSTLNTNQTLLINTNNDFVSLDPTYTKNQLDEFYLSYPGDNNLYRVTFIARTMSATEFSYAMICEKF